MIEKIKPETNDRKVGIEEISIENYLVDEYSICREERQYALLLYNILKARSKNECFGGKEVDDIIKECGLENVVIKDVFYEATFMRDFFERDRRLAYCKNVEKLLNKTYSDEEQNKDYNERFNKLLIDYALTKISAEFKEEDYEKYMNIHLGSSIRTSKEQEKLFEYIKCMMNSKPDIAVVGYMGEKEIIRFIECKFESGEDKYCKDKEFKDEYCNKQASNCTGCIWTQTNIQNAIGEFIDKYYLNKLSYNKEKFYTRLVRFIRKGTGGILIKDLLSVENKIWEGKLYG